MICPAVDWWMPKHFEIMQMNYLWSYIFRDQIFARHGSHGKFFLKTSILRCLSAIYHHSMVTLNHTSKLFSFIGLELCTLLTPISFHWSHFSKGSLMFPSSILRQMDVDNQKGAHHASRKYSHHFTFIHCYFYSLVPKWINFSPQNSTDNTP